MLPDGDVMIDPQNFAVSVRALLTENPRRYRNFGVFWFFVKGVLKRYFDKNEMPILGDYVDEGVAGLAPAASEADMLEMALAEYQENASFNLMQNRNFDLDGSPFFLLDPDVEG